MPEAEFGGLEFSTCPIMLTFKKFQVFLNVKSPQKGLELEASEMHIHSAEGLLPHPSL